MTCVRRLAQLPRVRRLSAAFLLAAMLWIPTVTTPPVAHAAVCTGWSSTTTPPPTVRVLRSSSGVVQTVDFMTYVKVVMPAEWPPSWPMESLRAGAVAIKQYAWYYTMHYRGGTGTGGCYDVVDNTNDQIYSPETRTPAASHIQAVDSTWNESILKNGSFILTGYRSGADVACGADADGYHLFQHSARICAIDGKTGEQILHVYFDPGTLIQGAGKPPSAPTVVSAAAYDTTAVVTWSAVASDVDAPFVGYTVTSSPDGRTCSTAGALNCGVADLINGTAYTFTVTATNTAGTGPASAPSNSVTPTAIVGATYHPLTPARVLDTRVGNGLTGPFSAGVPRTFQVTGFGGVPASATAVTGNLTVTGAENPGAIYLGPVATATPSTSTINFLSGDTVANGVTAATASDGSLSATYLTWAGTTSLVFDVTGYFTPDTSGATYHPLAPARILDTRVDNGLSGPFAAGTPRTFQVTGLGGVPSNATAVTGNLTVTDATTNGAVYLGPVATADPATSTINFGAGSIRANGVTVALGGGGKLSATYLATSGTANLIFDVGGYFKADASGSKYVPLPPARILDTRANTGLSGKFSAGVSRTFQVAGGGGVPSNVTAVTGNLTLADVTSGGAVYLGPVATATPSTSTINFATGEIRANGVTVALAGNSTLSATYLATPASTASLIFDISGYFRPNDSGATYHPLTPARVLDTRFGNGLSGPFDAGLPRSFQVAGRDGVPSNATAVTGNLTVTDVTTAGAVYLGPAATTSPRSSTINFRAGDTIANGVTVALAGDGTLSATYLAMSGTISLIFDVTGYFTPDASGATYQSLTPARVLDTRIGLGLSGPFSPGVPRTFQVTGSGGVPSGATAVTGNLTVTDVVTGGALYLGPNATASPTSSTINFAAGDTIANGVTVALAGDGSLSATYLAISGTTSLVFDVTGYFAAGAGGGKYVPLTPARILDTRVDNGLAGPFSAGEPRTFQVTERGGLPSGATAVTGNLTVTGATFGWAVYLGPVATPTPASSTINFSAGDVRANGVTVALGSSGTLSATYLSSSGNTTSLVFDASGYFAP